jgi:hypothetical protein
MATGTAAGATTERRRGRRQGRYLFIGRIRLEWWGHLSVGPLVAGTQSLNDEHASLVRSSPPFPNGRRADVHVRYGLHVQGGGGRARTLYREGSSDGIPVQTLGSSATGGGESDVKLLEPLMSKQMCRNTYCFDTPVSIRLFRYDCQIVSKQRFRINVCFGTFVSTQMFRAV